MEAQTTGRRPSIFSSHKSHISASKNGNSSVEYAARPSGLWGTLSSGSARITRQLIRRSGNHGVFCPCLTHLHARRCASRYDLQPSARVPVYSSFEAPLHAETRHRQWSTLATGISTEKQCLEAESVCWWTGKRLVP